MFKLNCLSRYILKSWGAPFIGILLLVAAIFMLQQVLIWLPKLIENGVPIGTASTLFLNLIPGILLLVTPVAYYFALYRSIKAFQTNSELDALYAGGLSLFNIFRPVFILGILLSIVLLWVSMQVVPATKVNIYNIGQVMASSHAEPNFTPQRFSDIEDITFYSDGKNSDGSYFHVMISDARENQESPLIYFAKNATITKTNLGLLLRLKDGNQISGSKDNLTYTNFKTYQIQIPLAFNNHFRTMDELSDFVYMDARTLNEQLQSDRNIRGLAEWHKRWVPSITIIILFFLAIPMSLQAKRSQKGGSFMFSLAALAIINQTQLILYKKISLDLYPLWSAWALAFVFLIVAIFLFMQVNKHGNLSLRHFKKG